MQRENLAMFDCVTFADMPNRDVYPTKKRGDSSAC